MIQMTEQGPPINELQVAQISKTLGAALTQDYKGFLLKHNGGRPEPDVVDIKGLSGSPTDVKIFFGVGRKYESSELFWQLDFIKECCPEQHVLPIASDSFGSLFCLKVIDGVASSVVFCDLSTQSRNFYDVAPTFTEFLNKLREWED